MNGFPFFPAHGCALSRWANALLLVAALRRASKSFSSRFAARRERGVLLWGSAPPYERSALESPGSPAFGQQSAGLGKRLGTPRKIAESAAIAVFQISGTQFNRCLGHRIGGQFDVYRIECLSLSKVFLLLCLPCLLH